MYFSGLTIHFTLQSLIELFRPQNLKDHQLRPQDKIAQGIHMKRPDFVHDFRGPEHGQDFDISPM